MRQGKPPIGKLYSKPVGAQRDKDFNREHQNCDLYDR
jgi:hypothetical protein